LLVLIGAVGIISPYLAYIVTPAAVIFVPKFNKKPSYLISGFLFLLVLSDNLLRYFFFAATLKLIYVVALTLMLFQVYKHINPYFGVIFPFILFFFIAFSCIVGSPVGFDAASKSVSYVLLLLIVPTYLIHLLKIEKIKLLRLFILTGILVFTIGLLLRIVEPALSMPRGRFSGLLGNPNGMGIFSVLYLAFITIVFYYYPSVISKREKYFFYIIIFISLILSGSRGGIFASVIFFVFQYLYKYSRLIGFVAVIFFGISYQLVESNFVEIVQSLGLEAYFRIETLEEGSGRKEAFQFAWSKIKDDPYFGKGFGYTEALMKQYAEELSDEGHQGNVHNSYLTIWLDTGLFGLIAFIFGWGYWFLKANKYSHFALPVMFAVLLSTNVESWLAASLNPFTILLVIILCLLTSKEFINNSERYKGK
jgi:O-antigen ligase